MSKPTHSPNAIGLNNLAIVSARQDSSQHSTLSGDDSCNESSNINLTPAGMTIVSRQTNPMANTTKSNTLKTVTQIKDLPAVLFTQGHIDHIKRSKLAQFKVASALVHTQKRATLVRAIEMNECGRYLTEGTHSTEDNKLYRPMNRCKQRSCPLCLSIKGYQYSNIASNSISQMGATLIGDIPSSSHEIPIYKRMIGLKINLNCGQACELKDLKSRLKILHSVWGRLLKTSSLTECTFGALRSTEVTSSAHNRANPHIHGLLLVRADTDTVALTSKIKRYWNRTIKRELVKSGVIRTEANTVSATQQIAELRAHTQLDVLSWLRYATKGFYNLSDEGQFKSQQSNNREFWVAVDSAIKGMRLIAISGDWKIAFRVTKSKLKTMKTQVTLPSDPKPTHAWSDLQETYVPYAEMRPCDDGISLLSQSLDRLQVHPQFGALFQMELKQHQKRLIARKWESALNIGNPLTIRFLGELFLNSIKEVKPIEPGGGNFNEPNEIERSSLREHLDRTKGLG